MSSAWVTKTIKVTAATSATPISSTPLLAYTGARIIASSTDAYIGGSGVTTATGFLIPNAAGGMQLPTVEFKETAQFDLSKCYVVSTSGTTTVTILYSPRG